MSTYKFIAIHNGQLEGSERKWLLQILKLRLQKLLGDDFFLTNQEQSKWPYTVSGGSNVSLIQ